MMDMHCGITNGHLVDIVNTQPTGQLLVRVREYQTLYLIPPIDRRRQLKHSNPLRSFSLQKK